MYGELKLELLLLIIFLQFWQQNYINLFLNSDKKNLQIPQRTGFESRPQDYFTAQSEFSVRVEKSKAQILSCGNKYSPLLSAADSNFPLSDSPNTCAKCRSLGNGASGRERTLAMIKPDGVSGNYTDEIKKTILKAGFDIVKEMLTQLDRETASAFYAEHSSKGFFSDLITYMTSGPVLVIVLEKGNAVTDWRALIGPTDARKAKISHPHSIRALCGRDSQKNCVHGSDSIPSAEREISFFFKEMVSGGPAIQHDEL